MNEANELDNLIQAYLDQRITEEEMDQLNQMLVESEAAQAYYWDMASLHWRLSEQSLFQQGMTLSYLNKEAEGEEEPQSEELLAISKAQHALASKSHRRSASPRRQKQQQLLSRKKRQSQNLWWVAAAASFIIGTGLTAIILNQKPNTSGDGEFVAERSDNAIAYRLSVDYTTPGNTLKRGDENMPLTMGMKVLPGDQVNTQQSQTMVQLSYAAEMTTVKVEPNSSVIFDQVDNAKHIEMLEGTIHADVDEQPENAPMKLYTSHSIATVLGTQFTMSTNDKSSQLEVIEGSVKVAGLSGDGQGKAHVVHSGHFAELGTHLTMKNGILEDKGDPNKVEDDRPHVTSLVFVSAATGEAIPGLENLKDGDVIQLSSLPTRLISIRADIEPVIVDDVKFHFRKIESSGEMTKPYAVNENNNKRNIGNLTEKFYPYYVSGDTTETSRIHAWQPEPGDYLLTATPSFIRRNPRRRVYGDTVNVRFTIVP